METATLTGTKRLMILQPCTAPELESQRFADEVRQGLLAHPKTLPWPYFYDEAGSRLFERICQQPEYYLTRSEDAILREHADAMLRVDLRPSLDRARERERFENPEADRRGVEALWGTALSSH